MKSFKDNKGRTWEVVVHVASAKRVQSLIGLDLYSLVEDGFVGLMRLIANPVKIIDVVYCLCKPQADAAGVSEEQFGEAMYGDPIQAAANAFSEAFADFFPDPRIRGQMREMICKNSLVRDHLIAHAQTQMDLINPAQEAEKLLKQFTTSPESSESTPAPSPSPN